MSDPDARPDPMDKAYVGAEAVLDEAAARAARRARVLEAVAREPATPQAAALPSTRRPVWRPARWLAAACVAGLGLFAVTQIYQPARRQTPTAPIMPSEAPTPSAQPSVAQPETPAPPAVAAAPRAATPASPSAIAKAEPPPPPSAVAMAPAPEAFPAGAAAPPPPPPSAASVAAEEREGDEAVAAQSTARVATKQVPVAISAFTSQSRAVQPISPEALAGLPPDQAARLRAAAAAGRTAEVKTLLARGVAVDAPDADGDTALMKSIQADQPATAALLRRHGASLDRENNAGESARAMATAKDDAALDRAIGLGP